MLGERYYLYKLASHGTSACCRLISFEETQIYHCALIDRRHIPRVRSLQYLSNSYDLALPVHHAMPLQLIPHTFPTDHVALYTINYRSFADEPAILALSPGGLVPSTLDANVAGFAFGMGLSDPSTASAKVIDTESGAIVAFAVLQVMSSETTASSPWTSSEETNISFPHLSDSDGTRDWVEWIFRTKAQRRQGMDALRAAGPWAYLKALGTVPERQREGAGTLLLQWISGVADAAGTKIMVEAGEAPVRFGLYEKFGFEKIDDYTYVNEKKFTGRKPTTLVTMVRGIKE